MLAPYGKERRQRLYLLAITVLLAFWLWGVLAIRSTRPPALDIGRPSPVSIQADRSVTYESEWRTAQERVRAERAPDTIVYTRDTGVLIRQRYELNRLMQTISQIRADPTLTRAASAEKLTSLPNSTLVITVELAGQLAALDDTQWGEVQRRALELYDRAVGEYDYAIDEQDLSRLREQSLPYRVSQIADESIRDLVLLFAGSFLTTNQTLDEAATQQRKQAAANAVQPVDVTILEGESIIRVGDVVTPDVLEKLRALDALETLPDWRELFGKALLAAMLAGILGVYLYVAHIPVWMSRRQLLLVFGMVAITALLMRLMLVIGLGWPYLFPIATMGLLLTVLYGGKLAGVVLILTTVLLSALAPNQVETAAVVLVSCLAGGFAVRRVERSLTFLIAGVVIAAVGALVTTSFWLLSNAGTAPFDLLIRTSSVALHGALASILALGLYNMVGQLAGLVTPLRLMELAHPAQPLLRKLIREAPGTYYHSLTVGNLAESAAEAIGADALLLRVASYYHDIGKTIRPYFFTDNQSDRENVHNDLDPWTSAEIIADHVREGIKMAESAGLPKQLIDFIATHHGTSVINHFYQMALRQQDSVKVSDFMYPGPKPFTREQAILMLADSVEATVRSKVQSGRVAGIRDNGPRPPGTQTIEELVTSIIDEKVRSGQLDDSPLSIQDLAHIRTVFIQTLHGIYHPRVDYTAQSGKAA